MGLCAQLLTRYLRVPTDALLASLRSAGIEMDTREEPIFIDCPQGRSLRQLTRTLGCLQQRAADEEDRDCPHSRCRWSEHDGDCSNTNAL